MDAFKGSVGQMVVVGMHVEVVRVTNVQHGGLR